MVNIMQNVYSMNPSLYRSGRAWKRSTSRKFGHLHELFIYADLHTSSTPVTSSQMMYCINIIRHSPIKATSDRKSFLLKTPVNFIQVPPELPDNKSIKADISIFSFPKSIEEKTDRREAKCRRCCLGTEFIQFHVDLAPR